MNSHKFHCYPFSVKLDRSVGSCNTLSDLPNKVCVPNKAEDLNLSVFNMIARINELKTLTKDISCKCKYKFDGRKCNSDQWWNNNTCRSGCKNVMYVGKKIIWNPSTSSCKNRKYLASIMDDSAIRCDEVIELWDKKTKSIPTNFNEKKATCITINFYILLAFFKITLTLLIAVSSYCYLIKYRAIQKHLFSFHNTNNE